MLIKIFGLLAPPTNPSHHPLW